MKKTWTIEELRKLVPDATDEDLERAIARMKPKVWTSEEVRELIPPEWDDEQLARTVQLLNGPHGSLYQAWLSETPKSTVQQAVGPDGLTRPERELNRWAAAHGQPQPFRLDGQYVHEDAAAVAQEQLYLFELRWGWALAELQRAAPTANVDEVTAAAYELLKRQGYERP